MRIHVFALKLEKEDRLPQNTAYRFWSLMHIKVHISPVSVFKSFYGHYSYSWICSRSVLANWSSLLCFFLSCYVLFGLLFVTNYFFSGVPVNSFHNKFKELMIKNKPFQCILFEHEGRGLKTRDSRYQCGLEPKRK